MGMPGVGATVPREEGPAMNARLTFAAPALLTLAALSACAPGPVVPTLVLYGGHRNASDPCRNVGVTAYTSQWLREGGALVACPAMMPNLEDFAADTGGLPVARVEGFILYRVAAAPVPPLRPQPL
jgi:hypothetical protein